MNFNVLWGPKAQTLFLRMFLRAANREQIAASVEELDRLLRSDPLSLGESRSNISVRLLFHPPFQIHFRVNRNKKTVLIRHIRWIGF
jgi:hypothetical protein